MRILTPLILIQRREIVRRSRLKELVSLIVWMITMIAPMLQRQSDRRKMKSLITISLGLNMPLKRLMRSGKRYRCLRNFSLMLHQIKRYFSPLKQFLAETLSPSSLSNLDMQEDHWILITVKGKNYRLIIVDYNMLIMISSIPIVIWLRAELKICRMIGMQTKHNVWVQLKLHTASHSQPHVQA